MLSTLGPLETQLPFAKETISAAIARLVGIFPSEVQVRDPADHLSDCGGSGPAMRLWHQDCAGKDMDMVVWANINHTLLRPVNDRSNETALADGVVIRFNNMEWEHRQPDLSLPIRAIRWYARAVIER